MLKNAYLLIKQQLETHVPAINRIQWYNRQYLPGSEERVLTDHSVYIEFLPATMQTIGDGYQTAELSFRVHHVTELYDEDDTEILHQTIASLIHKALHRTELWLSQLPAYAALANTDDDFMVLNHITRTNFIPDHAQTMLAINIQEFSSFIIDNTAAPQTQTVQVQLTVNR